MIYLIILLSIIIVFLTTTIAVDIKKIEENLTRSFDANSMFDSSNIGNDNTVEDKIVLFAMKLSELVDEFDLSNFYKKLETLQLQPLSKYSNKGFVEYDAMLVIVDIRRVLKKVFFAV